MTSENLTIAQQAALTSGGDFWHTKALPEAGIEAVTLTDGPHGLRKQPEDGDALGIGASEPSTCYPPACALGSSWDPQLAERIGRAIGAEAVAKNVSVVLGPGVNIKRSPLGGRNFEYFSEDPLLTARIGAAVVHGVQSHGVGTSLKHFAVNSQETDRLRVSANVDERTLREIYLPAFEHIVTTARPTTVMCAYNAVNGVPASRNSRLLTELLRGEWGFDGVVVSDWGAVGDRVAALAAGLDLEMPPSGREAEVVAAVEDGTLDPAALDTAARRVLTLLERTTAARVVGAGYDQDEHHDLARTAAAQCAVLLKNDGGLLPLDPGSGETVAVIGEFARTPRFQGGGSSHVVPTRLDSALDALRALADDPERIGFAPGFTLDGVPDPELVAEAVAAAGAAGHVLLFLGLPESAESEGFDRTDLDLPAGQLALLDAVAAVNSRVTVVLSNGAPVRLTPWQDRVGAVLEGWLLGQAGGSALARLLFGLDNPSGRLAETIPLRLEDNPSHLHFPGGDGQVEYGEGLYVGYRHYDSLGLPVAHPFGHGLSYTTFGYGDPEVTATGDNRFDVSFTVTNTGTRAGAEVAQLYVHERAPRLRRPEHELKGFAKVFLEPGESTRITITLDERSFAHWSVLDHRWRVDAGDFDLRIGASSRDVRLRTAVTCPGDGFHRPLTADSTLGEWLADPLGAQIIGAAMQEMAASVGIAEDSPLMSMGAGLPVSRIPAFTSSITAADIARLVAVHRELSAG
ncbi:glycoside hydrolase family 3 C-terminal domain-containing protein [Streptomyces sp. CBMA156]|uniref:glycoside hydrolase family 3 C-terminal domain-containing protein n=1 Tax=Streptomyces sp. CBMA156 TaxID=1930280 RepID=UPI001661EA08|nr:glycoside hydrolase family 3 C-terminal domain-containing protein [Streptomyces sp. CBMA156]MBD0675168.1 glycosyl hydrolase [Streptomyces sp. CBMA156]